MRELADGFSVHDRRSTTSESILRSDPHSHRRDRKFCAELARMAVRCLYIELTLYPKPGLVSTIDNGSHQDMTAATFFRSLFALRHYFVRIAQAGINGERFSTLKQLGIEAEQEMLIATAGINTHRGAIFAMGLVCASIARCRALQRRPDAVNIRAVMLREWGAALMDHAKATTVNSHGWQVAALHAASGAREEGALGFPSVFTIALPALQEALDAGRTAEESRIDALFSLMAHVSDTNVYYRGGEAGAQTVKHLARQFIAAGGTSNKDWRVRALACHHIFIEQRLSPGGAADLLAVACLLHESSRDC